MGLHETKNYFVAKKSIQYLCISNTQFYSLDIFHYLAPGYSYAKFLKVYQTEFFLPNEWFDSVDKLDSPNLPPSQAFYSNLNQTIQRRRKWNKITSFCKGCGKEKTCPASGIFYPLELFRCRNFCGSCAKDECLLPVHRH